MLAEERLITDPNEHRSVLEQAVKACRSAFCTVGIFSFCINLLVLTVPIYMIQVFDRVMTSRSEDTLLVLTVAAFLAFVIMASLEFVRSRMLVRIGLWLDAKLGPELFSATLGGAGGSRQRSMQSIRDLSNIRNFLTGAGIFAILDAPWVPLFIALIFIIHPTLGMTALVGALVMIFVACLNEVLTRGPLRAANTAAVASMSAGEIMVRQAEAAESMGMASTLSAWWRDQNARALGYQAVASDRAGSMMAVSKFVRLGLQVLILGLAALYVVREDLTIGGMIATSIMLSRALAPVEQSIGVWRNLLSARLAFQRIRDLLENFVPPAKRLVLPRPRGKLVVDKMAFVLDGADEPVFQNLAFTVNPGELLGITGPTGAGKSSLVRTLIGVAKPARGTVRLDGADIYDWNSDDLGSHIGYVPQVVELLPGTIHENIARFTDAPAEKVVEAARRAGIHDLVLRFPQGYDTVVGGLSDMLSVGTRQRVALARALFGEPQLVVLDEPYSNLDADGVQALMTAIQDLKRGGATTVIVAHRPSVMAHANRVMVLENGIGRVVERSKRADLTVLTNAGPPTPDTAPKPASKPAPKSTPAPAADDPPPAAAAPVDAAPAPSGDEKATSKPKSRKARKTEARAS